MKPPKPARLISRADPLRVLGVPSLSQAPIGIEPASDNRLDAVVLTEADAAPLIEQRLPPGLAAIVPVVDVSGQSKLVDGRADLHLPLNQFKDAAVLLRPMVDRLRSLPDAVLTSPDPRLTLLARLMVRDRPLTPRYDPNLSGALHYPDERIIPGILHHVDGLVILGMLRKEFFDRLMICPSCNSARTSVRERCAACKSTNLQEEAIIHHLRCAYQAPEHEFRRPGHDGLFCPKCRRALLEFSIDYDRPGMIALCKSCGHASGETSVGFLCLEATCATETDTDAMSSKDVYIYHLTDSARQVLRSQTQLPVPHDPVIYQVRKFVADHIDGGLPYCILEITLEPKEGEGVTRLFANICSLFAARMHEVFTEDIKIIESSSYFLALMTDTKRDVVKYMPQIKKELEQYLASPPAITYSVHGSDDILKLIEAA